VGRTAEKAGRDGAGQESKRSKRGIVWILAGLALTGLIAGYSWLRGLPR